MVLAREVASDGLVYALQATSLKPEPDVETYLAAMQNILETQDFDSIPLCESHQIKQVSQVVRRPYLDTHQGPFLVELDEQHVAEQDITLLACMFKLIESEHHMVYIKSIKGNQRFDEVMSPSILNQDLVVEHLVLYTNLLRESNQWSWNQHDEPGNDLGQILREALKKYADHFDLKPDGSRSTADAVKASVQELLEILGPFRGCWDEAPYHSVLRPRSNTPLEDTALFFSPGPFGSIQLDLDWEEKEQQNDVIELAFDAFTKANDWDFLIGKTDESYSKLLSKPSGASSMEVEALAIVTENIGWQDLIDTFAKTQRPICVKTPDVQYPHVVSSCDVVFHEKGKNKLLEMFTNLEMAGEGKLIFNHLTEGNEEQRHHPFSNKGHFKEAFKRYHDDFGLSSEEGRYLSEIFDQRNAFIHFSNSLKQTDSLATEIAYKIISRLLNPKSIDLIERCYKGERRVYFDLASIFQRLEKLFLEKGAFDAMLYSSIHLDTHANPNLTIVYWPDSPYKTAFEDSIKLLQNDKNLPLTIEALPSETYLANLEDEFIDLAVKHGWYYTHTQYDGIRKEMTRKYTFSLPAADRKWFLFGSEEKKEEHWIKIGEHYENQLPRYCQELYDAINEQSTLRYTPRDETDKELDALVKLHQLWKKRDGYKKKFPEFLRICMKENNYPLEIDQSGMYVTLKQSTTEAPPSSLKSEGSASEKQVNKNQNNRKKKDYQNNRKKRDSPGDLEKKIEGMVRELFSENPNQLYHVDDVVNGLNRPDIGIFCVKNALKKLRDEKFIVIDEKTRKHVLRKENP